MPQAAKSALIFGAGKIGRGFLGHLLSRSGYTLTFVDASPAVVERLNTTHGYPISVLGAPAKDVRVEVAGAIAVADGGKVADAVAQHELFVCSVGGANIPAAGTLIGRGLQQRFRAGKSSPVNVIVCENFKDPAAILRNAILASSDDAGFRAWVESSVGIAETQVLRSCIEPDDAMRARDPLSVQVQDWWVLPCDKDAIRGKPPEFEGLSLRGNFQNELMRKVYTYNCSNATISYLGYLRGYEMLSEAAWDAEILAVTRAVYEESGKGLIAEFGFDPKDQTALQELALSKYQDRKILDPIERNARDSQRKLSPTDRLMGPARIALKHGVEPRNLALAVAAALHYAGYEVAAGGKAVAPDAGTAHVQEVLRSKGLAAALREFCAVEPGSLMSKLVHEAVPKLAKYNKRGVRLVTH
ncbi:MAG: hypothetical protein NTW19_16715 [Planctomycetota bacterium]|nr:hypothetical protein [Planctomycetota bacterium]